MEYWVAIAVTIWFVSGMIPSWSLLPLPAGWPRVSTKLVHDSSAPEFSMYVAQVTFYLNLVTLPLDVPPGNIHQDRNLLRSLPSNVGGLLSLSVGTGCVTLVVRVSVWDGEFAV